MGIVIDRHQGPPLDENEIIALMRAEGLVPHGWGNAPGDTYGWHEHRYERSCSVCVAGSCSTPARAMPIWAPGTGWCCRRAPLMRPPSAPRACAVLKHPARARWPGRSEESGAGPGTSVAGLLVADHIHPERRADRWS